GTRERLPRGGVPGSRRVEEGPSGGAEADREVGRERGVADRVGRLHVFVADALDETRRADIRTAAQVAPIVREATSGREVAARLAPVSGGSGGGGPQHALQH